jgi:hypothetical protein
MHALESIQHLSLPLLLSLSLSLPLLLSLSLSPVSLSVSLNKTPPRPPLLRSITLQPPHDLRHRLLPVYPEPLLLRHACQLHILRIQLLLHDLLQRLEHQLLCLLQGQRTVVFGLELGLRAFGAGADGFGVVAVEGAGGFGVVSDGLLAGVGWREGDKDGGSAYNCGPSSSQPAIRRATPNGLDMILSSPSAPSPNLNARSQIACVQLSTPNFSL